MEQFKRDLPALIEYADSFAEIRKASFDAHIRHGFSNEQALELCKKPIDM